MLGDQDHPDAFMMNPATGAWLVAFAKPSKHFPLPQKVCGKNHQGCSPRNLKENMGDHGKQEKPILRKTQGGVCVSVWHTGALTVGGHPNFASEHLQRILRLERLSFLKRATKVCIFYILYFFFTELHSSTFPLRSGINWRSSLPPTQLSIAPPCPWSGSLTLSSITPTMSFSRSHTCTVSRLQTATPTTSPTYSASGSFSPSGSDSGTRSPSIQGIEYGTQLSCSTGQETSKTWNLKKNPSFNCRQRFIWSRVTVDNLLKWPDIANQLNCAQHGWRFSDLSVRNRLPFTLNTHNFGASCQNCWHFPHNFGLPARTSWDLLPIFLDNFLGFRWGVFYTWQSKILGPFAKAPSFLETMENVQPQNTL